jgi:hypothetical protein
VVLEAEIVTLDPHFIGAYITRTFGYMVFDTLFAPDAATSTMPADGGQWTTVSPDGLTWTFTLRDGLPSMTAAPSPPPTSSPRCSAGPPATRWAGASWPTRQPGRDGCARPSPWC